MEFPKEEIQQWCDALRSGLYKQTTGTLQNSSGYCCLGVACDLFIPEEAKEFTEDGFLAYDEPDAQPYCPEWLKKINGDFGFKNEDVDLMTLNDISKYSFSRIADRLEKMYLKNS